MHFVEMNFHIASNFGCLSVGHWGKMDQNPAANDRKKYLISLNRVALVHIGGRAL